jgi:hypothetical protein
LPRGGAKGTRTALEATIQLRLFYTDYGFIPEKFDNNYCHLFWLGV